MGGKSGMLVWVTVVMSVANSGTGAADVRDVVVAMCRGPLGRPSNGGDEGAIAVA